MPSCSLRPVVERARPLLGTRVAIRVDGVDAVTAHAAIDAAFAEVALVHARMSFHEADSDVGRLNREASSRPVAVHPRTLDVLRLAQRIAAASRGSFDITVAAPRLAAWRMLPRPAGAPPPDPRASWRDVEIGRGGRVRFRRPLWIDLGGIAKGYAVDRAIERLRAGGIRRACVNAGGDLRVMGPTPERVLLRGGPGSGRDLPVVELQDGSLASSGGFRRRGPHVGGARRRCVGLGAFACVVAERCVIADALTKVVLSRGAGSARVLVRYGATAYLRGRAGGWQVLGAGR